MTLQKAKAQIPAKWVLAGEHTVMRGGVALALPYENYQLSIDWQANNLDCNGVTPVEWAAPVFSIVERLEAAFLAKGLPSPIRLPQGHYHIQSTIPQGAGLGSSAALCVGVLSIWNQVLGLNLSEVEFFELARDCENVFHGKSSGMDIAAVLSQGPIVFRKDYKNCEKLGKLELPKFTLHDTGVRSRTADCIQKVADFRKSKPDLATLLDEQMSQAAMAASLALKSFSSNPNSDSLDLLANSIRSAQNCFESWGLVPFSVQEKIDALISNDALAVKLTGSGGGGFLVALWPGTR